MTKLNNRYITFKLNKLDCFPEHRDAMCSSLAKLAGQSSCVEGVFIEKDWPEYQTVCNLIENRITLEDKAK